MLEVHISKHGVGVGVWWWCCVLCVWCVGVGVGVWSWWCCVFCVCGVLCCFFFSQFSSLSFLLSLFFPSSLFSLLSSLLATKHCGKNRSTNKAANFEAFGCDLAHGRCTAVGSLPPSPPSSLLFLSSSKKERELFNYRNISGEGFIFYYSLKLLPKNRRRVKLQTSQLHINSKTIELQRVKL